ncbi:uncharacterized protein FIBRA_07506 [Fibroporia radiculosa]|uniref:HMG box domain-containing protein n=1 Tax=Fibroporia radiculosa TaxID=599839 RepID=J4I0T1_9APHY|nr:uncharacterized protein FIBRA_07506 [Fibroporia radiculosa]CCM05292.1 predicted protein [Fibroporia radiculosa]
MFSYVGQRAILRVSTLASSRCSPITSLQTQTRSFLTTATSSLSRAKANAPTKMIQERSAGTKAEKAEKPTKKTTRKASVPKAKKAKDSETSIPSKKATTKIAKADLPPKGAPSIYALYFTDYYRQYGADAALKGTKAKVIASEAAAHWKTLSDYEKEKYNDQLQVEREAYVKRMKEYLERVDPTVLKTINAQRKAEGKHKVPQPRELKGLVKTPIRPFNLYVKEHSRTITVPEGLHGIEIGKHLIKQCAADWKALSPEERAHYAENAQQSNEQLNA